MTANIDLGRAEAERRATRPVTWSVCITAFFLGNVLLWADRSNFSVAASAWARDYAWTPSVIGAMLSAFSFGYLIMQPLGGWIADRIGPRRALSAAMGGWSIWVLLTPLAPSVFWLTALFRILLGMSEAPYIPAGSSAIARAIPSESRRAKFSSFASSGAQLGPAVGVFFAGMILGITKNPAMIFLYFGLAGLIGAAGWWLYARRRSDPAPLGDAALTEEARRRAAQPLVPYRKLLTTKALWPFYFGYFALPYCQYIFLTWLPEYLTHYRHLTLVHASVLSAYPFLVAFVAANSAGWIMDWFCARGWRKGAFHRKFFIALGALIYASTTLVAANTSSTNLAVTMITIANAGLAFYVAPYFTICTDMAPRQAGSLAGLMNFFGIIGATISPFASGVIAQATGAFVAPLELAVAIMLVAATVAVLFIQVRPLSEMVAEAER